MNSLSELARRYELHRETIRGVLESHGARPTMIGPSRCYSDADVESVRRELEGLRETARAERAGRKRREAAITT